MIGQIKIRIYIWLRLAAGRYLYIHFLLDEYPHSSPSVLLDQSPPPVELDDHLQTLSATLQGTPALYALYQAATEWIERNGSTVNIPEEYSEGKPEFEQFQVAQ